MKIAMVNIVHNSPNATAVFHGYFDTLTTKFEEHRRRARGTLSGQSLS